MGMNKKLNEMHVIELLIHADQFKTVASMNPFHTEYFFKGFPAKKAIQIYSMVHFKLTNLRLGIHAP